MKQRWFTTKLGKQDEFPYMVHEQIQLPFVAWFKEKKNADEMKRFAKALEAKVSAYARELIAEKIKSMEENQWKS